MKATLQVARDLRKLADSIEALAKEQQVDGAEVVTKNKKPSFKEVRGALAALSQSGKQKEVKELITGFGAKKLSDIPEDKYAEILEKAGEI
ncbi:hypothetical protein PRVXH_002320 [Proteinivorax hydrogeniformans]|uniref:rRNA biogenesis protein rrp5 n=1 Tax=Proteinivorax hydrogeniformans TaxID=1826727 RepID=A0AAU8HT28_9FIRM